MRGRVWFIVALVAVAGATASMLPPEGSEELRSFKAAPGAKLGSLTLLHLHPTWHPEADALLQTGEHAEFHDSIGGLVEDFKKQLEKSSEEHIEAFRADSEVEDDGAPRSKTPSSYSSDAEVKTDRDEVTGKRAEDVAVDSLGENGEPMASEASVFASYSAHCNNDNRMCQEGGDELRSIRDGVVNWFESHCASLLECQVPDPTKRSIKVVPLDEARARLATSCCACTAEQVGGRTLRQGTEWVGKAIFKSFGEGMTAMDRASSEEIGDCHSEILRRTEVLQASSSGNSDNSGAEADEPDVIDMEFAANRRDFMRSFLGNNGLKLKQELGAGGQGSVWMAEDESGTKHAVKILQVPSAPSHEMTNRRDSDRMVWSECTVPHALKAIDDIKDYVMDCTESSFDEENLLLYLVLEHVVGVTIERLPRMDPSEALYIASQINEVIMVMGEKGVVAPPQPPLHLSHEEHRAWMEATHEPELIHVSHHDLKPGNILVDPETLQAVVLDYGGAIQCGQPKIHLGAVPLTPQFMDPDSVRGYSSLTDKPAYFAIPTMGNNLPGHCYSYDTFANGATLYYMLTRESFISKAAFVEEVFPCPADWFDPRRQFIYEQMYNVKKRVALLLQKQEIENKTPSRPVSARVLDVMSSMLKLPAESRPPPSELGNTMGDVIDKVHDEQEYVMGYPAVRKDATNVTPTWTTDVPVIRCKHSECLSKIKADRAVREDSIADSPAVDSRADDLGVKSS